MAQGVRTQDEFAGDQCSFSDCVCGVVQDVETGECEVLLDANALSSDGTVALSTKRFSEDAAFLSYGLSSSGSDWITIKVMRVKDRVVQPDTLSWVKILISVALLSLVERIYVSIPKTSLLTTLCCDLTRQVKFTSIAWSHDNKGFFYSRFPEPKYVTLGTE